MKVTGPLYSLRAHGWLGRWPYMHYGFVHTPYPIALFPRHTIASPYYSVSGYYYQRRRTWHGIITSACRVNIGKQPRTSKQQGNELAFANAMTAWQNLTPAQQSVYHAWKYPAKAAGHNRFIHWYLKLYPPMPLYWGNLDRSDSDNALISDDAVMKDNPAIRYHFEFAQYQAFNMVLHKGPGFPANPQKAQLYYDTDNDVIYKYNGAAWLNITDPIIQHAVEHLADGYDPIDNIGQLSPSIFAAQNSANIAVQTSLTAIAFNTNVGSNGGDISHSTVINNTRFTLNSTGWYLISFYASITDIDIYHTLNADLRKNGNTVLEGSERRGCLSAGDDSGSIFGTWIGQLTATDYVELRLADTTGGYNWVGGEINIYIQRIA